MIFATFASNEEKLIFFYFVHKVKKNRFSSPHPTEKALKFYYFEKLIGQPVK